MEFVRDEEEENNLQQFSDMERNSTLNQENVYLKKFLIHFFKFKKIILFLRFYNVNIAFTRLKTQIN